MSLAYRAAGVGAFSIVLWAAACADKSTDCAAGYTACGTVCCSGACAGDTCAAPAGGSSGTSGTSGFPSGTSGGPKDPECANEKFPSRTKYCEFEGRCVDPNTDSENCGECDNVCGEDTNGIPLTCFRGKCQ